MPAQVQEIDANGRSGTRPFSQRFKTEIKPMDKASEAIFALEPVTFQYKKEIDPEGSPQFGLVAEDVAKVNPELVVQDADGMVYTVRYSAVNVMLLNEFLKEHRQVQEQQATITELKSTVAQQQKGIEAVNAGLQKVSAQVQIGRPARKSRTIISKATPNHDAAAMTSMNPAHVYEIRPRKDGCGVNLISDVLPLRCAVLSGGPDAINNAIDYAKLYSRSHVAVIRVYDEAGNVIDTHE